METSALVHGEEMIRGSVPAALCFSDVKGPLIRPKPKRVGLFDSHRHLSVRWCKRSADCEQMDSKARAEILDLILNKEDHGCSPPFFSGSPPSRVVSNPIVQDANFGNEKKLSPLSTLQYLSSSSPSASPSPSHKGGGCSAARMNFGLKPAAVRIEGFECRGLGRVTRIQGSLLLWPSEVSVHIQKGA